MIKDLSKFSKQITLWGSPRVVKKWVKFRENGANPDAGMENLFLLEEIMNDMRKDLGVHRVDKGNLLGFFVNDIKDLKLTGQILACTYLSTTIKLKDGKNYGLIEPEA